jgi:sulfatase modifying factor 1
VPNHSYIATVVLIVACRVPPEIAFTDVSSDGSLGSEPFEDGRLPGVDASDDVPDVPGDALSIDGAPHPTQRSSCIGLAMTCGPSGTENCCDLGETVVGGMYLRAYDEAPDDGNSMDYPATVGSFVLDKYEVTVGRFRRFVDAGRGTQMPGSAPAEGSGAHSSLAGSGWDSAWNANLAPDTASLKSAVKCFSPWETWTDEPGNNEDMPMSCVTWYEAMAFCIWDGGYLPTKLELNYAASGGSEQRAFPWSIPASSTDIDCTYANYFVNDPPGDFCVNGPDAGPSPVGSTSPKGDARWKHSDLAGNIWEWGLDWYEFVMPQSCNNCANLIPSNYTMFMTRFVGGGGFGNEPIYLRAAGGAYVPPVSRSADVGIRCARAP